MRPDRIIVGEVRGGEALDMLQAMNTGHDGSLTTCTRTRRATRCPDWKTMISWQTRTSPIGAMRDQIASAFHIHLYRSPVLSDGTRRVTSVTEVTGMEGEVITTQEIYRFKRRGIAAGGEVVGQFESTGIRPKFLERLAVAGVALPEGTSGFAGGTW